MLFFQKQTLTSANGYPPEDLCCLSIIKIPIKQTLKCKKNDSSETSDKERIKNDILEIMKKCNVSKEEAQFYLKV